MGGRDHRGADVNRGELEPVSRQRLGELAGTAADLEDRGPRPEPGGRDYEFDDLVRISGPGRLIPLRDVIEKHPLGVPLAPLTLGFRSRHHEREARTIGPWPARRADVAAASRQWLALAGSRFFSPRGCYRVASAVHWPLAVPLTVFTAPRSPGAGVLPVHAREPLSVAIVIRGAIAPRITIKRGWERALLVPLAASARLPRCGSRAAGAGRRGTRARRPLQRRRGTGRPCGPGAARGRSR